jgi:hypothetical protein
MKAYANYSGAKWRVVVKVSLKESRIFDKGWSFGSGTGRGLTHPHCKNRACGKMLHIASGCYLLGLNWLICEHGAEVAVSVKGG